MKKAVAIFALMLLFCSLCLSVFSGCELFRDNDRSSVDFMSVEVREDGLYVSLSDFTWRKRGQVLKYDFSTGALNWEVGSVASTVPETVLEGCTVPYNHIRGAEGYEALEELLLDFTVEDVEHPDYHVLAFKQGRTVYGFCNVYAKANFFGDCLDCDGIDRAVLFEYDYVTEKLTVIDEMEGCIAVAFDGVSVVWYRDRAFYGKALGGEASKICDDECYREKNGDNGRVYCFFGDGYCVIYFDYERNKFRNHEEYDKYVLATMTGEKLAEVKLTEK